MRKPNKKAKSPSVEPKETIEGNADDRTRAAMVDHELTGQIGNNTNALTREALAVEAKAIGDEIKAGQKLAAKAEERFKSAGERLLKVQEQLKEQGGSFNRFLELHKKELGSRTQCYRFMAIAGGKTTVDECRAEDRKRQERVRESRTNALRQAAVRESRTNPTVEPEVLDSASKEETWIETIDVLLGALNDAIALCADPTQRPDHLSEDKIQQLDNAFHEMLWLANELINELMEPPPPPQLLLLSPPKKELAPEPPKPKPPSPPKGKKPKPAPAQEPDNLQRNQTALVMPLDPEREANAEVFNKLTPEQQAAQIKHHASDWKKFVKATMAAHGLKLKGTRPKPPKPDTWTIEAQQQHDADDDKWRADNAEWLAVEEMLEAQWFREQFPAKYAEGEAFEAKRAARKAKRIACEAKNPQRTLEDARWREQKVAMEDDEAEARKEARECGESWSEKKEEWQLDWIETYWDERSDFEIAFREHFEAQWLNDHGAPFPEHVN